MPFNYPKVAVVVDNTLGGIVDADVDQTFYPGGREAKKERLEVAEDKGQVCIKQHQ